jgi:hypothetical protein
LAGLATARWNTRQGWVDSWFFTSRCINSKYIHRHSKCTRMFKCLLPHWLTYA